MRRPLFLKIFVSVSISFFFALQIVWLTDSLAHRTPSRYAEQTAILALSSASSLLHIGGEKTLRDQIAKWPAFERERINVRPIQAGSKLAQDQFHGIFATTAVAPSGMPYAITYTVTRFDGFAASPLAFDMGPRTLFGSSVAILIFSALLTLYLTIPIRGIRRGFRRLAAGHLETRLSPTWSRRRDEIADLAADFNQMATRLEELVASRDRLLADVSHELRSPLARLQVAIGLARQSPEKTPQSLLRIGREADKLEELVGELLALSRLENGSTAIRQYFYLSEIVGIVIEDARFEGFEMGVTIEWRNTGKESEVLSVGSGRLVSRAIENIVRNALRFSRRGDTITAEMHSDATGSTLYIRDQGPGVKAEDLTLLFDPFVQLSPLNGQGYGLGLSIAKRAIIAHGGTIEAANGAGSGLVIKVWLPAAPGSPDGSEECYSGRDIITSALPQKEALAERARQS